MICAGEEATGSQMERLPDTKPKLSKDKAQHKTSFSKAVLVEFWNLEDPQARESVCLLKKDGVGVGGIESDGKSRQPGSLSPPPGILGKKPNPL